MDTKKDSITRALKAAGYGTKQVSVRCDYQGELSITLTIRDPSVDHAVVEQIGRDHETKRYDETSGEMLAGGNTFVETCMTEAVRDTWAAKYLPVVEKAMTNLTEVEQCEAVDARFVIYLDQPGKYQILDYFYDWLPQLYTKPVDVAVDLYIRSTGKAANLTQDAVFRYWFRVLYKDKNAWKDSDGKYNSDDMIEAAVQHYQCPAQKADPEILQLLTGWATEFIEPLSPQ